MRKVVVLLVILCIGAHVFGQEKSKLDSLRNEVERVINSNEKVIGGHIRLLYHYLFEAKTTQSKKDIILAYQQMATRSYALGNTSDALKYYKLYVIELEELSEIEVYKNQSFEKNLYENEIRALNATIQELEAKIAEIEQEKGNYQDVIEIIYVGLKIVLVIAALLLVGYLFARYRRPKKKTKESAEPISNQEALTEVLHNTKRELVRAETELDLSDILVHKIVPQPEEYFVANKSLRKKFLLHKPKKLAGGAGLFLTNKQNITIVAVFDSQNAGAAGGLLSNNIYHFLDEIINQLNIQAPGLILEQLETKIKQLFPAGVPFSGGISAAIIAYDNVAKTITYAGAGFPLYKIEHGKSQKMNGSRGNLLIEDDSNAIGNEIIDIVKGIRFILSSKVFLLQHGGTDYKPFGEQAFLTAIESLESHPMEEQGQVLGKIFNEWLGGGEQEGDLLVLGFGF